MYRYVGQGKQNLMILKLPILWYFCLSKTVFFCFSCKVVFCLVTPFYHVDHKMFQLDTSSRNSESGEFKGLKKKGSSQNQSYLTAGSPATHLWQQMHQKRFPARWKLFFLKQQAFCQKVFNQSTWDITPEYILTTTMHIT